MTEYRAGGGKSRYSRGGRGGDRGAEAGRRRRTLGCSVGLDVDLWRCGGLVLVVTEAQ